MSISWAFPGYFLFFKVKPETIDINIHPTKTEIKFDNETKNGIINLNDIYSSLHEITNADDDNKFKKSSFKLPFYPKQNEAKKNYGCC